MALLARKKILLAKVETTYGTDSTPTGATNAIQTSDMSITPLAGPTVSRNLDRATLGNDLQIQVGTYVELSFMVEIAGGGGADTAPAYGPLLEACAFAETVNASTDVDYDPVSSSIDSATLYFHHDGQLRPLHAKLHEQAFDVSRLRHERHLGDEFAQGAIPAEQESLGVHHTQDVVQIPVVDRDPAQVCPAEHLGQLL